MLYRFETQDIMMVDVGNHLVKFYMDPLMCHQYTYMETVVIGLILQNQFLNVKI